MNLDRPWYRAAASVALWSYSRVAQKLGLRHELRETLIRWRPVYLQWMKSPATPEEAGYLEWFEELLEHLRSSSE